MESKRVGAAVLAPEKIDLSQNGNKRQGRSLLMTKST